MVWSNAVMGPAFMVRSYDRWPRWGTRIAVLVDAQGNITVKSDATRQVLEWFKKIVPYFPESVFSWDNGIWNFSANKSAAKSLLMHLSTRSSVEKLVAASRGYDIPPFEKLLDFKTWAEEEPPKGTIYNYPPRGDVISLVTGYPAPIGIGTQMFAQGTVTKMIAQ